MSDSPFVFPSIEQETAASIAEVWRRQDLQRYLGRWQSMRLPEVPTAFYEFEKRALDVGCGFGKYVLQEAPLRPDWGFLGVDKGSLRGGKMVERIEAAALANAFGLHTNAIPLLAAMPDDILDELTIFYPNPWWPNKHRKKRWAWHPLLPKLFSMLKVGGTLRMTSNEGFYLGEVVYAAANHPRVPANALRYQGEIDQKEGRTHFETKFLAEGTPCGEICFERLA